MKVLSILAVLLGGAFAAPAKLDHLVPRSGYDYTPPEVPSGLYDLPSNPPTVQVTYPPTTTTTTTTPPPPPPSGLYDTPDHTPDESGTNIRTAPPKSSKMLMPYEINWGVEDAESGNMFRHIEDSDGENVTGEYSVLLPDGRMQTVRFTSDPINGYQAEVSYSK